MKTTLLAAFTALATITAAPAFAQAPAASGALSVQTTPIGKIAENPAGKAILEKDLPELAQYLDQVKDMTLAQLAPMSQGAIDDAKLKTVQADLDKIK